MTGRMEWEGKRKEKTVRLMMDMNHAGCKSVKGEKNFLKKQSGLVNIQLWGRKNYFCSVVAVGKRKYNVSRRNAFYSRKHWKVSFSHKHTERKREGKGGQRFFLK